MATYLPPSENLAIFDPNVFNTGDELLTYADAETKFLKYPIAQGAQTFQDTTIVGTLGVGTYVSTFNEEVIILTDNGVSALPSLTLRDTVSNDNFLFNPNATGNTYNALVEPGDAVITTSNNNQGLVLTNTNSTTTNGIRISTTNTRIGNGGGGVDIPTHNITFDSTAVNPITVTSTNSWSFNQGIILGTAGAGEGTIAIPTQAGRFEADFSSGNNFTFKNVLPNNKVTDIWVTPTRTWGGIGTALTASTSYYNGGSVNNSNRVLVGISQTEASINTALTVGASPVVPIPLELYCNGIKCITLLSAPVLPATNTTFEGLVTSNATISFANAGAKLKYPTADAVAGYIPTSDGAGLLTLAPPPTPSLSQITGTLPTVGASFPITVSTWVQYGSITLTAGTWLVSGRIGLTHTSGGSVIYQTATGISTTNVGVPDTYILQHQIEQDNPSGILPEPIRFADIQTIITVASTTTYYLMAYMFYSVFTIGLTVSTLAEGGQQLTATRIA